MKQKNRIANILLTAIAVIFCVIFLLPPLAISVAFLGLAIEDNNTSTVYYDDGTVIYNKNGPIYDHVLFDHISVSFEGEAISSIKRIQPGNEDHYDRGRINKFTFDRNGFIAYHVADDDINEYRLFSDKTDTIQTFASMKELYDFCSENDIRLGKWYYGLHLEQTFFENNGWTLTTDSMEASHIRHNGEELFSGQIDKYFYTPDYLFFKFQHFDISRYEEEPNPVIPVDESVVIRKRINTSFIPFRDEVHAEKYIFIDTKTDKYILFDDEASIEEYAASLGISPNWHKIKFNDKINN